MRKVRLHGLLKEKYGDEFDFIVDNPVQACAAMNANFPGFYQYIRDKKFQVVIGDIDKGVYLNNETVNMNSSKGDINIIPYIEGAGGGGRNAQIAKIVVGVALIGLGGAGAFGLIGAGGGFGATAFTIATAEVTWGNLAVMGVAMALTGASSLMAPSPEIGNFSNREAPNSRPSFLFNGAVNTTEQGSAIPLVYGGPMRVGSIVISAGLTIEQL